MSKSHFRHYWLSKPAFTCPHQPAFTYSYQPSTLVWRRITPADCRGPRGKIPSADQVDRLLDESTVSSTWRFIEEGNDRRKARDRPVLATIPPPPPPLLPTPPLPRPPEPSFVNRYPDVHYEERTTENRSPIGFRIYHPNQTPALRANIFFIPPPASSPFQPDRVIPHLSYMTSATIITPRPGDTLQIFPQSLHTLLKIYDHCRTDSTKTAVLTAGIAAPLATSIALTEPGVHALGIWGGVLDLTVHASKATAWDRKSESWKHYPPPPQRAPASALGIPESEFWALRKQHFPNPETWTDPFASPQLFFRSAGVEFSRLTLKQIWGRNALAEWNRDKIQEEVEELQAQAKGEDLNASLIYPRRQARLMQDFPPEERELPFPRVRIVVPARGEGEGEDEGGEDEVVVDADDVVEAQGLAFAEMYKSSLVRWFNRYDRHMRESEAMGIAENKVLVDTLGSGESLEYEVGKMGHWLKWVLEQQENY